MKRLLVVTVGILAITFLSADTCSGSAPAASSPAAPDKSPAAAAAKASPAAPQVLLDLSGSGSKSTQTFAAPGNWDLAWTYDCANFGMQGNFIVFVYNATDNSPSFQNQAVNQLGTKGSDVQHYHQGGTFYLEINSGCNWTVKATG